MFDTRTRLLFFACLKDAAGAALKNAAPAPGSDQQKNRLRLPAPAPQYWDPHYNFCEFGTGGGGN